MSFIYEILTRLVDFLGLRLLFDQHFAFTYNMWILSEENAAISAYCQARQPKKIYQISLVLPLWGIDASYVRELFESIEEQTYESWELCICVDHDTNLQLRNLLAQYQRKWSDRMAITWHSQNQGISAATRSAISLAQGDIIAFIDGDDILHKRALECFALRYEESPEIDFVYCDMDFMKTWGLRHRPVRKPAWSPHLLKSVMYIAHLKTAKKTLVLQCIDAFDSFYDGSQDWNFCLKATAHAQRISHIPLILYHWRERPGSMAVGAANKPWAIESGLAVQEKEYRESNPKIRLGRYENMHGTVLPTLASLDQSLVLVRVSIGRTISFCQPIPEQYRFQTIVDLEAPNSVLDVLEDWDSKLAEIAESSLLFFQVLGKQTIYGDIVGLGVFATMPEVGAVWPMFNGAIKYGYTIHQPFQGMVSLGYEPGFFNSCPSNTLTGPLHGMMIQSKKFQKLGGFSGAKASMESDRSEELGMRLGLACFKHNFYNVSTPHAFCQEQLPSIAVSHEIGFDPYLLM